jgi:hypothetical protein
VSAIRTGISISPGIIRNFPVVRIRPIIKFDSVINDAADTRKLQELKMGKLEAQPIESIQGD